MTGMVDLKKSKGETPKNKAVSMDEEPYGYGLTVHLDHHHLKKLGIHTLPKAGTKLHIRAHAHVKAVRDEAGRDGEQRRGMDLELRKMEIAGNHAPTEEALNRGAKKEMDRALTPKKGKGKGFDSAAEDDDERDESGEEAAEA